MPAIDERTVRLRGLAELQRAFSKAEKRLGREFRAALREAAEPVRGEAETLALREIRNIGPRWSRMRVGVTRRSVYVAPRERGTRAAVRRRPNLAGLLMDRAMDPALDAHQGTVVREVERMLDELGERWERE